MKTTTELEQENAHLRAELDAALALKRDVGELCEFTSQNYPEQAGKKCTRVAIDAIESLRAKLDHASKRWEWWQKNAEAIAQERGELFRAGEAMRAAYVAHTGTEKTQRVEQWDAAAQPIRDMFKEPAPDMPGGVLRNTE